MPRVSRRRYHPRAERVHPDPVRRLLQGQTSRHLADAGLGSAVGRSAFHDKGGHHGGDEEDAAAAVLTKGREGVLGQQEGASQVQVDDVVERRRGHFAERGTPLAAFAARVADQHVESCEREKSIRFSLLESKKNPSLLREQWQMSALEDGATFPRTFMTIFGVKNWKWLSPPGGGDIVTLEECIMHDPSNSTYSAESLTNISEWRKTTSASEEVHAVDCSQ